MVIVKRATLDDKPAIYKFIQIAYENRWQYKIPERWQWEFVENPFLPDQLLPVWIAVEEDGRVVGQTCALVEPLKIGDEIHRVGWSVDTFLLPEYRGQGIGFQLQKANDEGNEIFMSLSMSKANRRIKAGLGSVPIDPVPAFTRLARYTPESIRAAIADRLSRGNDALKRIIILLFHLLFLDRLCSSLLNIQVHLQDRRQLPYLDENIALSRIDIFDQEINLLWDKVSPKFYAIVKRDDVYLNWKYVQQPYADYYKYIARRNGDICGYIIFRQGKSPERNIGVIADILALPEDVSTIRTMLSFAVLQLIQQRVKDIHAASTVPAYQEQLLKMGFKETKGAYPMFHYRIDSPVFKAAEEPGSWFLGKGDHDWDQYPLAR